MIQYLDESIDILINSLKDNKMYDNSLILVSTDNGGEPAALINEGVPALSIGSNFPLRCNIYIYLIIKTIYKIKFN